ECTLWTIINAGADINLQDEWGKTPLHVAVEHKESIMIKVLMEAGVNALIADNEGGPRSGHVADTSINHLYRSVLRALIKAGADINVKDNTGKTPLHLAARHGEPVLCNLLLKLGVNVLNDNGMRARMWGLSSNAIHDAVLPMVNMICAAGANVNAVDYEGRTPLHLFALSGYISALYRCSVLTMIHAGADIDAKDMLGKTPLHLAVEKGEVGMIKLLMELGVNALITDDEG
ncbi:ankyrin, partial [Morchella conica CCBAS932]